MDVEIYLRSIISKYSVSADMNKLIAISRAQSTISVVIKSWAGNMLQEIKPSGSIAKGTAISTSADLDLFISLKSETTETLSEIYNSLAKYLEDRGYKVRLQNVSIRVMVNNVSVDLVPGKMFLNNSIPGIFGQGGDHSIYKRKADSWTKTNVDIQTKTVRDSGKTEVIKLSKIWRDISSLDFPSIYLELSVINSLHGSLFPTTLSKRFVIFLNYLADKFEHLTIEDPGNKSNKISDDLSVTEKRTIAEAAKKALLKNWDQVLW